MKILPWLEGRDDFVLLDCARVGPQEKGSLLFLDPLFWLRFLPGDDVTEFFRQAQSWSEQGFHLAGWFAYEFGLQLEPVLQRLAPASAPGAVPLAVLGVFREVFCEEQWERIPHFPAAAVEEGACRIEGVRPGMTRADYLRAVARIQEYIAAGDTYQVNFTLPLHFQVQGSRSALYQRLRRSQHVSYGAWIREGGREIMSFSPELFFRWHDGRLLTRPMKGTMRRGLDQAEDALRAGDLRGSIKNRAENVMIVDLLRNDLSRLLHNGDGGAVRVTELFQVETYETLLQMTSTVEALPASGRCPALSEMFSALFPCGSVTGAPKIRTMEIIREMESACRGVYTGAIGCLGPERTVFSVPIRTLELRGEEGRMGIGSGIVHDSDAAAEWEECLLKAEFLTRERPPCRLIETLRWQPGCGYWLLEEHLRRLRDSAAWLLYSCDLARVRQELEELAAGFVDGCSARRVRLTLDREGQIELSHAPCDALPLPLRFPPLPDSAGCPKVVFARERVDPADPYRRHKTTHRAVYDETRARAQANGWHDALFVNSRGEVTESAIANVFVSAGTSWRTPPVSCGLLPGVCRHHLLEHFADRIQEAPLSPADVLAADAVYLVNSVRGMVRVQVNREEI